MKQGCPLSPTPFNIRPVLQRLTRAAAEEGYHIAAEAIATLAYADDILVIWDTETGMLNLLRISEDFFHCAQLTVNPDKCRTLSYIVQGRSRTTSATRFTIEGIPAVSMQGTFEYLDAAIGVVGARRMRAQMELLERAETEIALIATLCPKESEVVDAIRRFILPRLMSNTMPRKRLKQLDTEIRGIRTKRVHATGLPEDFFYTNWRGGGLSLPKLEHR